jgi:DNA-binding NarL/FixJ family response regulator
MSAADEPVAAGHAAPIRVLIADDHRLVLDALKLALASAPDIEIVAATHEGVRVVPLVGELQPDLVLVDYRMPEIDGLTILDRLRARHPEIAVVLLTGEQDERLADEALERGASAFILKTFDVAMLAPALRAAMRGEHIRIFDVPEGQERPGKALGLTEREEEVLGLVALGLSNARVAGALGVAPQTVKFHVAQIYTKLGVSTRLEASRIALQRGVSANPFLVEKTPAASR